MKDEEAGPPADWVGNFCFGAELAEGSGSVTPSLSSGNREKGSSSVWVSWAAVLPPTV